MIASLKGIVTKKLDKGIIVDTGNIGYLVFSSKRLLAEIEKNQNISFFIHSHIREDAFELYGFTLYEDLILFEQLIQINGIGPKVALEILSVPSDKIKIAIVNENFGFLREIKGIGEKTAKRIIIDMKDKIDSMEIREKGGLMPDSSINNGVIDALIKLGYQRNEITRGIKDIPKELKEPEEIIKYFLKNV